MIITYARGRTLDVEQGNRVKWIMVSGLQYSGVFLGIRDVPWPRNLTFISFLMDNGTVMEVGTNLVWRAEVVW